MFESVLRLPRRIKRQRQLAESAARTREDLILFVKMRMSKGNLT